MINFRVPSTLLLVINILASPLFAASPQPESEQEIELLYQKTAEFVLQTYSQEILESVQRLNNLNDEQLQEELLAASHEHYPLTAILQEIEAQVKILQTCKSILQEPLSEELRNDELYSADVLQVEALRRVEALLEMCTHLYDRITKLDTYHLECELIVQEKRDTHDAVRAHTAHYDQDDTCTGAETESESGDTGTPEDTPSADVMTSQKTRSICVPDDQSALFISYDLFNA